MYTCRELTHSPSGAGWGGLCGGRRPRGAETRSGRRRPLASIGMPYWKGRPRMAALV